jgi:hypothetical protein
MSAFRLDDLNTLGVNITKLVSDSRAVQPGDTFVAYPRWPMGVISSSKQSSAEQTLCFWMRKTSNGTRAGKCRILQ